MLANNVLVGRDSPQARQRRTRTDGPAVRPYLLQNHLANHAPVRVERPINQQTTPDEVFFGHRSPVAAIVAVVTVITQSKVATLRHGKRTVWLREIFVAQGIAAIRR